MPVIVSYPAIYAQKRHRTGHYGNYDPSSKDKEDVYPFFVNAISRAGLQSPYDCAVGAICVFTKKKSATEKKGLWTTKPDIDNLEKFVFDVAERSGIVKNDSRICMKISKKVRGEHDRTDLLFLELSMWSKFSAGIDVFGIDGFVFSNDQIFIKKTDIDKK